MCIFMTQGKIRRGSKQLLTPFANCLHWRWSHLYFCLFQYQVSYQLTQKLLFCKNWYLKNWAGENRKILKCLEFISNFDLTYNFCKCFPIYLKYRTYCVFRKKLIYYIKFQVRIERVFDKNEVNNTFKAQSSEFVNFEMQKWMAPASCSSLFNIVSSYIWGARRLFATLDLLSRFKCQNVVQQLSLLGFNYNFEAICCCFFYLSCTPQNIIIFFRRSKIISVIWWSSSILEFRTQKAWNWS